MDNLIIEKHSPHINILKIHRPDVLNAVNKATLEEMLQFLHNKEHQKDCHALILTGSGEKSFIAGADIKEMKEMSHVEMLQFCELGQEVTLALQKSPFLTLAAVNGYALGGGFEMALACDFIYASTNAKFGFPEVSLGIIPGFGGTQRISRAVGTRLSKELVMSGRIFTAEMAKGWGIVNHLAESDHLMKDCLLAVSDIVRHSFWATSQAKRAIDIGYHLSMVEALELEKNMCAFCFATKECNEGMAAFLKKHKKG
ncbi:MAG: enoyl-CoA hydratase/isomerase family protein [Parachlamydiaceae bacterium]|nr:enoyl-CoA hydratase/isomerase family protein [Parachlamydiaceae bacterium]